MKRDISPPEAILLKGRIGSPGLKVMRKINFVDAVFRKFIIAFEFNCKLDIF